MGRSEEGEFKGQSFNKVSLYFQRPLFSHGQLYVTLSRSTSKKGIKIQSKEKVNKNIVCQEIFL